MSELRFLFAPLLDGGEASISVQWALAKIFQGAGSEDYVKELRTSFEKVSICKPAASAVAVAVAGSVCRGEGIQATGELLSGTAPNAMTDQKAFFLTFGTPESRGFP